jgi:hypothetical protein
MTSYVSRQEEEAREKRAAHTELTTKYKSFLKKG